jgi:hypothetical protein
MTPAVTLWVWYGVSACHASDLSGTHGWTWHTPNMAHSCPEARCLVSGERRHAMRVEHAPVRPGWSCLQRALVLSIGLVVGGCAASHTAAVATPTPTTNVLPSATQVVPPTPLGGRLGPAPATCAAMLPQQTFTMASGFGGGFSDPLSFSGGAPVWELGLYSPLQAGQLSPDSPYPSFKVMWIVGPNVTAPVTLRGHDVHTGAPLWFQIYPSNSLPITDPNTQSLYTTDAVLDARAPNRGSTDNSKGHWGIWGIGLVPLAAGCYELEVSWASGQWRAVVAAGA